MPEISRFFGIIITMHYNDHAPPHFHARYGGHKALIGIRDGALIEGSLPPRVMGFVSEWAALHRAELQTDWELAQSHNPLNPIAPLE